MCFSTITTRRTDVYSFSLSLDLPVLELCMCNVYDTLSTGRHKWMIRDDKWTQWCNVFIRIVSSKAIACWAFHNPSRCFLCGLNEIAHPCRDCLAWHVRICSGLVVKSSVLPPFRRRRIPCGRAVIVWRPSATLITRDNSSIGYCCSSIYHVMDLGQKRSTCMWSGHQILPSVSLFVIYFLTIGFQLKYFPLSTQLASD